MLEYHFAKKFSVQYSVGYCTREGVAQSAHQRVVSLVDSVHQFITIDHLMEGRVFLKKNDMHSILSELAIYPETQQLVHIQKRILQISTASYTVIIVHWALTSAHLSSLSSER